MFAAILGLHYYLIHVVLGPLRVDELYFAHVFWLLRQGLEQYRDFYSSHLPAYFWLLGPLLPPSRPDDLTFVSILRATGLIAAIGHAAMVWRLDRLRFVLLLPVLLLFLVLARMTEIRPDTIGLLLFNGAWLALLRADRRRDVIVAAMLGALALLFSARAAVMIVGLAVGCAWWCWRRRDHATFLILLALAMAFAATVGLYAASDPARFTTIIHAVYLAPSGLMPHLDIFSQRILPPDRLLMVALILLALVAAIAQRAAVIFIACATQLLLILLDPSPYQYVYGWALLPTLAGLALLMKRFPGSAAAGLALTAALPAVAIYAIAALAMAGGQAPGAGSAITISLDRPFAARSVDRLPAARLVQLMITSEGQQGLWNQLAVLGAICRRIKGPVLTNFYANTVCLHDSRFDWAGLSWPPLIDGAVSKDALKPDFEALIARHPPQLVAWGKQFYRPPLSPWGRALLKDYAIYDGFALRRDVR